MATIKSYTDIEQSRKLVEILPLESADMYYSYYHNPISGASYYEEYPMFHIPTNKNQSLSCWSLAALLGVIKEQGNVDLRFLQSTFDNRGKHLTNVWCCTFENIGTVTLDLYADNPIDAVYELVLKLNELKML